MAVQQISSAQGRELASNPGFVLRADAAKAWDRAVHAFGKDVLLTGAWRSYETQVRIFKERYRPGAHSPVGDYRTWPQYLGGDGRVWGRVTGAAAAVPGTSNHGGGVAVDVKTARQAGDPPYSEAVIFGSWNDADRARFLRVAAEHGWDDDEGRSVGELWHLTYYPSKDQHRGDPVPGASKPSKPAATPSYKPRRLPVVNRDDTGGWVGLIQDLLNVRVDQDFGPATEKAVKAFQGRHDLKADGIVGPKTWLAFLTGGVAKGDRGPAVKVVQNIVGLTGRAADGVYGSGTEAAVKARQRYLKVPVTGKFGLKDRQAVLDFWSK